MCAIPFVGWPLESANCACQSCLWPDGQCGGIATCNSGGFRSFGSAADPAEALVRKSGHFAQISFEKRGLEEFRSFLDILRIN